MNREKSDHVLKVAIAILVICLLGLGFYTFQSTNTSRERASVLKHEKTELKAELQELLAKYNQTQVTNETGKAQLIIAKKRVQNLLDSLDKKEATYVLVRKYKMQVRYLRQEKKRLFFVVDSLEKANKELKTEIVETKTQLAKTNHKTDVLQKKVKQAAQLNVVQLKAWGVKVKNNGELRLRDRAWWVDQIKVCFTLPENPLADSGRKKYYVQIINPENNLLGDKGSVYFGEKVLTYSKIVEVSYIQKRLEICTLVSALEEDLVGGTYRVNIFQGQNQMAAFEFSLK